MVLHARDANGDKAQRLFHFIREEAGDPNEVSDSNTPILGADYPDTVWVRFSSSDGSDLNASYSDDGITFTEMPETTALAGTENPTIGFLSLAGEYSAVM